MTAPTDSVAPLRTDRHFHVGVRGDAHPEWGRISERTRAMWPSYDIFLLFAGVKKDYDTDAGLESRIKTIITTSSIDRVVCLALDHVYDPDGTPRPDRSDFWVANEYVLHVQREVGPKVLLGASVHPFRQDFQDRYANAWTRERSC